MMAFRNIFLFSVLFVSCSQPSLAARLSAPVQQLVDDYWNWRLMDRPEYATFVGFHDYNDRLDDFSLEAYQYRFENVTAFLAEVNALEPNAVEHDDSINLRVLRDELQLFIDGYPFRNFLIALSNREGINADFMRLLGWMPLSSPENYYTMISRLEKVPIQIQQIIDLLQEGQNVGIVLHESNMNKVPSQLESFITADPAQSPIYVEFFMDIQENITIEDAADIQNRALAVIGEQVTPAFATLRDWIVSNYVTRPDLAVTSLPNGEALYAQSIRFFTGTTMTPDAIQQLGYDEVDRIEALMYEIVQELGYTNMTVQDFSNMLINDPNNFYKTEEELMEAYRYIVYNVTTPAVPLIFKNIPQAEILVVPDPTLTGALYLNGAYDGSRPGVYYVGTQNVSSQGKYEMLTLSLHEGNPGHHLQGSHAIESPNIPYFRGFPDDRNYGHSPSRFPIRSDYIEGWGLYAESTGFDMNLFGDPLDRYGHYSDEMFRACRLVVDTGLHAFGWTKEQAVDYIMQHTAMTKIDVESEVDRYVLWPAQALSYKIGQIQIAQHRADAEQQLGELFDLKDFHDVVLESLGPMTVLAEEVDRWIQSVLSPQIAN